MAASTESAGDSGPEHHALKCAWSFWEQRVEKKGDEKWKDRALQVRIPASANANVPHQLAVSRAGVHSGYC